ncbi:MAG TPA: EscN/YscN/HrcN family type III secretion system ATPase, partial [Intrasporangium sp.]|nr:EscN/YscN/HrcN family type III secretion system ATPase [Intrasporangium sp.]
MRGLAEAVAAAAPERVGRVTAVRGLGLDVAGLACALGDLVEVGPDGAVNTRAQVVASAGAALTCMPLSPLEGLRAGMPVRAVRGSLRVPTGPALCGRVLDALGRPIDDLGPLVASRAAGGGVAPRPMDRTRIDTPLTTGVRALDTLTTV